MKTSASPVKTAQKGSHLIINQAYLNVMEALGFQDVDSVFNFSEGQTVKDIKARSVTRFEFEAADGKRTFFLKRHHPEFRSMRDLFGRGFPKRTLSSGCTEFRNICAFRDRGIATVAPVAAGEKRHGFFRVRSFLITEDFSPFISLERLLRERPEFFSGAHGAVRRKKLLKRVCLLAAEMHRSGFNHRDFNATHILLSYSPGSDEPGIALFDLQRVDRNRLLKFRWMIKSLARLNYTLPEEIFSEEDRVFMIRSYKGRQELTLFDRFQWFWIQRKTARIKRHMQKKRAGMKR